MGYYINENSKGEILGNFDKAEKLIKDGAKIVKPEFQENLICVVENPTFDAAAYAFSEQEFEYFKKDDRHKTWLVHTEAKKLSGYEK